MATLLKEARPARALSSVAGSSPRVRARWTRYAAAFTVMRAATAQPGHRAHPAVGQRAVRAIKAVQAPEELGFEPIDRPPDVDQVLAQRVRREIVDGLVDERIDRAHPDGLVASGIANASIATLYQTSVRHRTDKAGTPGPETPQPVMAMSGNNPRAFRRPAVAAPMHTLDPPPPPRIEEAPTRIHDGNVAWLLLAAVRPRHPCSSRSSTRSAAGPSQYDRAASRRPGPVARLPPALAGPRGLGCRWSSPGRRGLARPRRTPDPAPAAAGAGWRHRVAVRVRAPRWETDAATSYHR